MPGTFDIRVSLQENKFAKTNKYILIVIACPVKWLSHVFIWTHFYSHQYCVTLPYLSDEAVVGCVHASLEPFYCRDQINNWLEFLPQAILTWRLLPQLRCETGSERQWHRNGFRKKLKHHNDAENANPGRIREDKNPTFVGTRTRMICCVRTGFEPSERYVVDFAFEKNSSYWQLAYSVFRELTYAYLSKGIHKYIFRLSRFVNYNGDSVACLVLNRCWLTSASLAARLPYRC